MDDEICMSCVKNGRDFGSKTAIHLRHDQATTEAKEADNFVGNSIDNIEESYMSPASDFENVSRIVHRIQVIKTVGVRLRDYTGVNRPQHIHGGMTNDSTTVVDRECRQRCVLCCCDPVYRRDGSGHASEGERWINQPHNTRTHVSARMHSCICAPHEYAHAACVYPFDMHAFACVRACMQREQRCRCSAQVFIDLHSCV